MHIIIYKFSVLGQSWLKYQKCLYPLVHSFYAAVLLCLCYAKNVLISADSDMGYVMIVFACLSSDQSLMASYSADTTGQVQGGKSHGGSGYWRSS